MVISSSCKCDEEVRAEVPGENSLWKRGDYSRQCLAEKVSRDNGKDVVEGGRQIFQKALAILV